MYEIANRLNFIHLDPDRKNHFVSLSKNLQIFITSILDIGSSVIIKVTKLFVSLILFTKHPLTSFRIDLIVGDNNKDALKNVQV